MDPLSGLDADVRPAIPEGYAVARQLAQDWDLILEGPLPGATGSLVLAASHDGEERVLRVPLRAREREASLPALLAFSGHGGVRVLASDPATGATLLPRLGGTLAETPEREAIEVCASLILRLRGAEGTGPSVAEYLASTLEATPLPPALRPGLAEDAARLARRLLDTAPPPRLLHADLHHFNVLRDGDDWVAIDPEGLVGDPAYECAAFLRNPVPDLADESDLPKLLERRIARFAERLGDPHERIWGWAFVRTAGCVSWSDASPFHAPWTTVLAALDELSPRFSPLSGA